MQYFILIRRISDNQNKFCGSPKVRLNKVWLYFSEQTWCTVGVLLWHLTGYTVGVLLWHLTGYTVGILLWHLTGYTVGVLLWHLTGYTVGVLLWHLTGYTVGPSSQTLLM